MTKEEVINYVKCLGGIETKDGWNVPQGVDLFGQLSVEIPIKFNIVNGNFSCSSNQLTSLNNCPKEVYGDFYCSNNKLTSLKYCPKKVRFHFECFNNNLSSLKYCPKEINGDFYCYGNKLTSFKCFPKKFKGAFWCNKGKFEGREYYKFLFDEKLIKKEEYLLRIV